MRKIYKILLVGLLMTMLIIGTVTSVNADKNIKIDKTTKENIRLDPDNIEAIAINPILRGKLIGNFENNLDGFTFWGDNPNYRYVSGKIGLALKVWSDGGNGLVHAYKNTGYLSEGDTIFFYGKGYVEAGVWDGRWASHIVDTTTGCGTSYKIWNDCNEGQPYTNWKLFKVVADRDTTGNALNLMNANGNIGESYAGYYDYVANIWIVPQPKDFLEFIWPGPPKSITNLKNTTYQRTSIKWTWTDPITPDFSKVMVYINGQYKTNVAKGKQYYVSTGLLPNTLYKISTHTVDAYGNVNKTWVNRTTRTAK